jgi:hypothetical protein
VYFMCRLGRPSLAFLVTGCDACFVVLAVHRTTAMPWNQA